MEITKRNGMAEPYNKDKVAIAIRKSFASTGQSVTDETILTLVNEVENFILSDTGNRHVERIQDEVERSLMAFMPKPKTISFIAGNGQNGEKPSTT
jgi:ribonucleoside-diphosphate reductase alpha chain